MTEKEIAVLQHRYERLLAASRKAVAFVGYDGVNCERIKAELEAACDYEAYAVEQEYERRREMLDTLTQEAQERGEYDSMEGKAQ